MLHQIRHAWVMRLAVLGAVLAGFALALLLAVSPAAHEELHHGSGDPEHHCLATIIGGGGCDDTAPEAVVTATFLASLFATVPAGESTFVEALFLDCGVFEHAPPAVS